jgi:hypothetical protein
MVAASYWYVWMWRYRYLQIEVEVEVCYRRRPGLCMVGVIFCCHFLIDQNLKSCCAGLVCSAYVNPGLTREAESSALVGAHHPVL